MIFIFYYFAFCWIAGFVFETAGLPNTISFANQKRQEYGVSVLSIVVIVFLASLISILSFPFFFPVYLYQSLKL